MPRAALWFAVIAIGLACVPSVAADESVVSIAGNGALGVVDGRADQAEFLVPTGLARGRDGTIYVSDEAAQRIRTVSHGVVKTVAGSGALGTLGMSVIGGYRDGPALQAQFNHPMGLTIGPDGALYIADSANQSIRKLDGGIVSTVVGQPAPRGTAKAVDGATADARLVSPRALAFDHTGALWIADFGGGLRRFSNGRLETIPLKSANTKDILSLSVSADANDQEVIATAPRLLVEYDIARDADTVFNVMQPAEASRPFGTPSQVLAIGKRQVLFTDLVASNVRYLRLPTLPYATVPYTHVIAGGALERGNDNAAFADGPPAAARFDEPRGLAIDGDRIIVADAGNRRVRSVPLPHFRLPDYGLVSDYDDKHYEIALVGPSVTFWDSYDDRSICGTIESQLRASHRIAKPVRCHTNRIDAASAPAIEQYIDTFLTIQPHIDLVLFMMDPRSASDYPGTTTSVAEGSRLFRASLDELGAKLAPTGARLMMVWEDENFTTSDGEDLAERETQFPYFPDELLPEIVHTMSAVRPALTGSSRIFQYDSYPDFVAYEKAPGPRPPLYGVPDTHTNPRGNVFMGEHIAEFILRNVLGH
jgi:sugar lactone lactonase YvrE